ncbi:Cd(II)/Pb(II)-responsive transcriptional regulator [Hydrocarboniphaga effusa]|jgi:Cd(II)/Pb(II)-responsive transcriptional regulator|uniref:Cd(II)/Pb(II)-responsive transcriptional regulator n=1 Tax=Hydrocarboniphaga effusa TaxID=243629 RepID=UPI003BAB0850|eukprot:TRINITY_DN54668_c0_g1_i5.p2 TRINITY_DN54668_c0_g1~~TRINITY_DN54668_c0_g1_i5.p2  ORF type:complete len:151 (-),score=29.02 TRINITY_DN54668_c0_g1_i5:156-608(-)
MSSEPALKIGDLAAQLKVPAETIRYYEKEGLLPPPRRTEGNYRVYDTAQVDRLAFIRNCRMLDMTLDEIRQLLALRDSPDEDCSAVNALVDEHIQHVESRIAELQQLQGHLLDLRRKCKAPNATQSCRILSGIASEPLPAPVAGVHKRGH